MLRAKQAHARNHVHTPSRPPPPTRCEGRVRIAFVRKALFKIHWFAGRREEAKDQLIELLDRFHDSYGSCHFAEMYFLMGKEERAYHWLQKAIDAKESFVPLAGVNPSLKKYHSQPRFRELFKTINHPMYVD